MRSNRYPNALLRTERSVNAKGAAAEENVVFERAAFGPLPNPCAEPHCRVCALRGARTVSPQSRH